MIDDELLLRFCDERENQPERERDQHWQKEKRDGGRPVSTVEVEAQSAPRRISRVEGKSAHDEPRYRDDEEQEKRKLEQRRDGAEQRIDEEDARHDQISVKDLHRIGEVLEGVTEQPRVGVEVP